MNLELDPRLIRAIDDYDIPVPQDLVEEEAYMMDANLKHQMQYGLMGGMVDMQEGSRQMEELLANVPKEAYRSVKTELVLKDVIRKQELSPTAEELEAEARRIGEKENIPEEMLRKFFGMEYQMLVKDLQMRMAMEWLIKQMTHT